MERYLTVTIDRHGRAGRTSASSSVLSTLSEPRVDDQDPMMPHVPLSRSRHSVDCSASVAQRQASTSGSRLHLGVPSDLRRSSLQTDRHHPDHQRRRRAREPTRADSACDGAGCTAQSSGSRSSVVTVDEPVGARRVSYGGGSAPLRSVATSTSTPRDTTIFDIGADLIKVSRHVCPC